MALPNKPSFCKRNCRHLNVTEKEQTDKKSFAGRQMAHFCTRYGKSLKHLGYEPDLVKLTECDIK